MTHLQFRWMQSFFSQLSESLNWPGFLNKPSSGCFLRLSFTTNITWNCLNIFPGIPKNSSKYHRFKYLENPTKYWFLIVVLNITDFESLSYFPKFSRSSEVKEGFAILKNCCFSLFSDMENVSRRKSLNRIFSNRPEHYIEEKSRKTQGKAKESYDYF